VAFKMLAAHWVDVSITLSLAIMGAILAVCALASMLVKPRGQGSGSRDQGSAG
jgi:tellurite resistance protein TerC